MDAKTPEERDAEQAAFRVAALTFLAVLKPTVEGVRNELERQQKHNLDHEYFMIHEFKSFTRALDDLTAQLARMK